MDGLDEIKARAEAATPRPWVAVDIRAAAMAGSSYCSGCYVLEVDPHDEGDGWAKPHGPDCWCDNPAWVPLADAERWDAVTPKIGPLVTVEDPLSLTAELEAKDAEIERLIMRAKTAETAARLTEASPSAFEFTVAIAKKSVEIERLRAALEDAKAVLDKPATELSRSARLHLVEAIIEQTLAAQDATSTADYIRTEAERLPNGTAARFIAALDDECLTCSENDPRYPKGECHKSERPCGHHCNCSWTQDTCHWCGIEIGEDA